MKYIKINYTFWLSLLLLFSIWIIISVDLEILPLIPSNLNVELTSKLNRILLNISYSNIAAFIFFWFTTTLPRKIRIQRSKKIISRHVHSLLIQLFRMINQILYAYKIEKKIEEVQEKDLINLSGNVLNTFKISYLSTEHWKHFWKKGKQFTGSIHREVDYPESVVNILNSLPNIIEQIRKANPKFQVDESFAEIITSIETNPFLETYANNKYPLFLTVGSNDNLYSLINDYKRLYKLKYQDYHLYSFFKIRFFNTQELVDYDEENKKRQNEYSLKFRAAIALNPCIVYNPSYLDSTALISSINAGLIYRNNSWEKNFSISKYENDIIIPNLCGCIVLIAENIPKNKIIEFVKNYENEKFIIHIESSIYRNTSKKKYKNKEINFGYYKLYYRKPVNIFGIEFYKKHPTRKKISKLCFVINHMMHNRKPTANTRL
ncbi:hypothetical protein [Flavobacterium cellulosilyticum]|uniref:Uncharacterized protein n=1 Tax=Flavobacterium cellulosilyticum TaxID=2541731 RepID=A0A4R5CG43_9FLAO|nr:hypothetical protein [Flavobacterium cellulosilyticum]TDD96224.1 hypothetical protein E0F76_12065 [Flavobacterium cellulosilyticum]